ncbi:methylated-DNA--protein-cysteine methyltransferase [Oscillochloris trichoides DG-6]|uniref:methylated-DNA--[protein]-cysteine S-methyltransferase n=1 Tax=Oscillochloris trichoides DG-6 TaxID=765420 RepID=E1IIG8_9CHLR|nr:methylated-DNA--[protein]-cysteine S-methyltransferase [Oscillochloris trichoides]EFO79043.1 methylated-DNA--protein-cysteine methyltransferase [Oscillochloris trichoides DG-6]
MLITYTIADSPLGRLLVASTAQGLCAVSMADVDATLEAALRADYPQATLTPAASPLPALATLLAYLVGQTTNLDLPVDVAATPFQQRVWQALRAIPYGQTRTYTQIATDLGNPNAARAVGRACATNRVALVIPCHRAVGSGGTLHGFRWGLNRKRALLDLERLGAMKELTEYMEPNHKQALLDLEREILDA